MINNFKDDNMLKRDTEDMWKNMIVPAKDFNDDDWEDPSMSGWLTLYCVWLMFVIVMGLAAIWQMTYIPVYVKTIGYFSCLLPAYSLLGVMMRFRDTVATSIMSLLIFILNGAVQTAVGLTGGATTSVLTIGILGLIVNICWMVYFLRSHLISVRFPRWERRIFAIDKILYVLSLAICLVLNFFALSNIPQHRLNASEYSETLRLAENLKGMHDHDVVYVDCSIEGNYCILYFTVDNPTTSRERFESFASQPYFSDALLFDVDKRSSEFVKSAIGDGLILVFKVFYDTVDDALVFKITPSQIATLKEPEPLPDLTPGEMEWIRNQIEAMVPSPKIGNVTIKSSEWLNEIVLVINFEVDEGKASYADVYDDFKEYSEEIKKMLMEKQSKDVALNALWDREMIIKIVLKGSKTGYSREIPVF